jgi:hypothetical protein
LRRSWPGGNRNDVTKLIPLIEAIPPISGKRGRPQRRPRHLYADRGYDHETYRDRVRALQITPHIRLRMRWEIRDDIHQAFVILGWAVNCGDDSRSCLGQGGHRALDCDQARWTAR